MKTYRTIAGLSRLFSVFLFGLTSLAFSQSCPVDHGKLYGSGSVANGRKLKSWEKLTSYDQLPPFIANEIRKQLIARVGEEFMSKIQFDEVMLNDYDSRKPLSAKDVNRIDEYEVYFMVVDIENGLKAFRFTPTFDARAKMLGRLELPNIRKTPEKGSFISCSQAVNVAVSSGIPADKISVYFGYDAETDTFVWDIHDNRTTTESNASASWNARNVIHHVFVDANTGKILRRFDEYYAF